MAKKIIIGGGGTGGHIFPAIAVANALKLADKEVDILFVGALNRIEMEKVPEAGYRIIGLPVEGFQRKLSLKSFSFFLKLWKSMRMSAKIIKDFKPDVALGVGGYASGPILRAASRKNVPFVIQEQNSYAGVTNRLLAKSASKICVAYDNMERFFPAEKIILTGNPVRQDILNGAKDKKESLKNFKLDPGKQTILILGGSLGARSINNAVAGSLLLLPDDVQLLWQCGKLYYEEMQSRLQESGKKNIMLLQFIREMDMAFSAADIIVSRAGAGTISELAIVGKPVILVPSPNVAEDHQTQNALSLVKKGASILVKDIDADKTLIETALKLLKNRDEKEKLSQSLQKLAIRDSADRIAKEILSIEVK
ncbi:MAG: undecaprenyldiphospho-muramoylpentapeptide beta-N-acetylglucosaminyltransferase [Bacteroidales bacterium]|nr:undecaprenyldiphospho-muramoylpentapeptide beta-N-acetylglucosaminyltransferase [Bacteroidales bacterium]MCB9012989.1 undecaprenyldiphospho-muramoylpentapeptide beta-N-acetylglucosaminyltransferase [Bacteroidales bacterium]